MLSCRLPVKIVMAALILLFNAGQVLCSYEFLVSVVGSGQENSRVSSRVRR